jgi:hypothetical protein
MIKDLSLEIKHQGIFIEEEDVFVGDLVEVYCGYQRNWKTKKLIHTSKSYKVLGVIIGIDETDRLLLIEVLPDQDGKQPFSISTIQISKSRVQKIRSLSLEELLTSDRANLRKLGECLFTNQPYVVPSNTRSYRSLSIT